MGLLDRIVADLIADSTGLPIRGLVRRVGVGRLLLLGGAAAAGGYAVQQMSQQRAHRTASPLPPVPPSAPPPLPPLPAPPAPQSRADELVADPELELALARAMVSAALADGRLEDSERTTLIRHLDGGDVPPEHAAQIQRELLAPAAPEVLAALIRAPEQGDAMLRAALVVLAADDEISAVERSWLLRLGTALGVSAEHVTALENELATACRATPDGPAGGGPAAG